MIGTNLAITTKNYAVAGGVTYDADALAYFNANTAITSDADKNAINTFYLGLKSDGIYTKMKAMYLPIWGSAATSKWNLVNPLDTDAAFRLTFSTGVNYNSNGLGFNGTSTFADTNLTPSTAYSVDFNKHLSYYSQTSESDSNGQSLGCDNFATNQVFKLLIRDGTNQCGGYFGGTNGVAYTNTNIEGKGFYLSTRPNNTSAKTFKNGSLFYTAITSFANGSAVPRTMTIGAVRSGTVVTYYDNKTCSFASIGDGLTDTQSSNLYTRVQTLMTYFGINV
jgi:hypothetical protein